MTDPNPSPGVTLDQARDAIRDLLSQGEDAHWKIGAWYNLIVDRKLAQTGGYKDAAAYVSRELPEIPRSTLTSYARVARAFPELAARTYGLSRLELLLSYLVQTSSGPTPADPGPVLVQVPNPHGATTGKPFSTCTAADLKSALRHRQAPKQEPSAELPPEYRAPFDALQRLLHRVSDSTPLHAEARSENGTVWVTLPHIPLDLLWDVATFIANTVLDSVAHDSLPPRLQAVMTDPSAAGDALSLDQARDAIRELSAQGEDAHWRIGDWYNRIVEHKWAERAGYKDAADYVSRELKEIPRSTLLRHARVARAFPESAARAYGMSRLDLLLSYLVQTGSGPAPADPGPVPVQVPDAGGATTAKPFSACTAADLRHALGRRRAPPTPPANELPRDWRDALHAVEQALRDLTPPVALETAFQYGTLWVTLPHIPFDNLSEVAWAIVRVSPPVEPLPSPGPNVRT